METQIGSVFPERHGTCTKFCRIPAFRCFPEQGTRRFLSCRQSSTAACPYLPGKFMSQIDRNRVRRAFSEKADSYDALAVVQQRVVMKFLERIITPGNELSTILDV